MDTLGRLCQIHTDPHFIALLQVVNEKLNGSPVQVTALCDVVLVGMTSVLD